MPKKIASIKANKPAAKPEAKPEQAVEWAARMKSDWNARAERDPLYWTVNSVPEGTWDTDEYLYTGETTVRDTLDVFFADMGLNASAMDAFEIGCGAGRITCALAKRFRWVTGTDVSGVMVNRAKKMTSDYGWCNTTLFEGNGSDLEPAPSSGYDMVYSAIVFQHIPDIEIQKNYLREIGRILRPGGYFCISLYNDKAEWLYTTAMWEIKRRSGGADGWGELAALELPRYETSIRNYIAEEDVRDTMEASGLVSVRDVGIGTGLWWVYGQKT